MHRRFSFALVASLVLAACNTSRRADVPRAVPTPALAITAGPHADSGDCILEGDGDPLAFASFEIFAQPGDSTPIAVVTTPDEMPLRFTHFPPVGESDRAKVELSDNGLVQMAGWVDLRERRFQLGARVDLGSSQVFALAGTIVRVRGRAEGGLEVEVPAPFREPTSMKALVPCHAVAYRAHSLALSARRHSELPAFQPRGDALELFTTPGGASLFHVGVTPSSPTLSLVERRGAFAHVLIGDAPGEASGTVIVDAWVRNGDIELSPPNEDRDSHGSIRDRTDRCPNAAHVARDTPLRLGSPTGAVIGVALAGAELERLGVADGFVAIAFADGRITAPRGTRFFVRAGDVSGCSAELGPDDDGCPCAE